MGLETMQTSDEPPVATPIGRSLPELAVRREVRFVGVRVAGRRRRPSGERPPMQRELHTAGRLWLLGGIAMVALWISLFAFPETADWWTARDNTILRRFVDIRTSSLTSLADAVAVFGSSWFLRVLRIGTIIALITVRRFRHIFAVLLAIILVQATVELIQEFVGRPRPFVPIIGDWEGPAHPSGPVAGLGVTVAVMAYTLVPGGRRRNLALGVAGSVVCMLTGETEHPADVGDLFSPVEETVGDMFGTARVARHQNGGSECSVGCIYVWRRHSRESCSFLDGAPLSLPSSAQPVLRRPAATPLMLSRRARRMRRVAMLSPPSCARCARVLFSRFT